MIHIGIPTLMETTGEIDLPKYFDMANNNNCRAVLEAKTIGGLKQSIEWLKLE